MKYFYVSKYRIGLDIRELVKGITGIGSVCEDGYHCLFLDLDNINEEQLRSGIVAIQKAYGLSHCYVFQTSTSSYHVICLDKLTRGMAINIIDHFMDTLKEYNPDGIINHMITSLRRRYWTLRTSPRGKDRITYVTTLKSSSKWKKSNAHRLFLNEQYGLKIPKTKNFDNYTQCVFDYYTAKKKILKPTIPKE